MLDRSDPTGLFRRPRWLATGSAALLLLALAGMAVPLAAQPEPEVVAAAPTDDLRAEAERLFNILPQQGGFLLEPKEDMDGVAAIQIDGGTFIVDGDLVSEGALRERLGEVAETVVRLGALDAAGRAALFGGEAGAAAPQVPAPPAPPAPPRRSDRRRRTSRDDAQIVVGGSLTVEADEEVRDAVVFGGPLTIRGRVIGDAVAIGGSARIEGGEVTGDVAAIGGGVRLEGDANVMGDVVSVGGRVEVADSARFGGELVEVPFSPSFRFGGWPTMGWDDWWRPHRMWWEVSPLAHALELVWEFFAITILALVACLAYLLAQGPIERMERRVRAEPWKCGLVGLLAVLLFVPVVLLVVIVLAISIIGIPLLLLVPFALLAALVLAFLGYVAVAYRLGRWAETRFGWNRVSPYAALVVGVALIQAWSLISEVLDLGGGLLWFFALMFGIVGVLWKFAAWTVGIGAVLLTRFGTADGWDGRRLPELPPTPAPPPAEPAGAPPSAPPPSVDEP